MRAKMIIFAEALGWVHFRKVIILDSFLISFSSSFLKNKIKHEIENEPKMAQK
jgi:hypothetical protein